MRRILAAAAIFSFLPAVLWGEADGPDYYRVRNVAPDGVLPIRAAPDTDAALIGAIPHDGDGIRNLLCEGRLSFAEWEAATEAERAAAAERLWCRVEYDGVTGWAQGRYLAEGRAP